MIADDVVHLLLRDDNGVRRRRSIRRAGRPRVGYRGVRRVLGVRGTALDEWAL